MRSLTVWLHDARVGMLTEHTAGGLSFVYDDAWLAGSRRPPLSRSLPPRPEQIRTAALDAFFGGLLPEGNVRQRVAANLGLSEDNDFALLAALGGDCAGALRLLPEGDSLPSPAPLHPLKKEELAALLHQLPRRPLLAGDAGVRLSLAGAQSKLPIRYLDGRYELSTFEAPSTHILKPESPDFPGVAAVEAFCLDLARRVGLTVARGEWLKIGEIPCLREERYDREIDRSTSDVRRIHQEDFCQALALPSHRKYQQEGGPSAADALICIREWSTVPVLDVRQMLDLLVFNLLIGNADAHGKNFSWIYTHNSRRLAPAYDLVSTTLWPELSTRMAMRIGQAKFIGEVTADHFLKFAEANRIGKPGFRTRMEELCEKTRDHLHPALEAATDLPDSFQTQLATDILHRADKLVRGS